MYKSDSQKKSRDAKATLGCCPHIQALGLQRHTVLINFQGLRRVPHPPGNNHLHCAALAAASAPINFSVELRLLFKALKHTVPTLSKPGTT